jgi:hypothetical protein
MIESRVGDIRLFFSPAGGLSRTRSVGRDQGGGHAKIPNSKPQAPTSNDHNHQ